MMENEIQAMLTIKKLMKKYSKNAIKNTEKYS